MTARENQNTDLTPPEGPAGLLEKSLLIRDPDGTGEPNPSPRTPGSHSHGRFMELLPESPMDLPEQERN